ncbi:2'-5' RNA ligase [Kribbella antiqua]|uniref:2'-5' RNA ligase n=1 Tax=Kribbella antiqua TaxID=2512217 RepID=A0A4V2S4T2_9ACTN|nr:2'-5' RNA ligase family protein [Kribbella antiqua]TCO49480.1 2'-5' RNA ligase [Kribbella antiqua]
MFDEVRDHWYWRPGWRAGRSFYTWHITFDGRPEIAALHASYADLVNDLPGFTPVPLEWLHLTLQGVGFTDRVPDADLADIVEATRSRVITLDSFPVTIGPAVLDPETIKLPVRPAEPLQHLRDLTRAAITDVWGDDAVPELPELNPHITLAYSNQTAPAAPLTARLAAHPPHATALSITSLTLLSLTQTNHLYHWTPQINVTLK